MADEAILRIKMEGGGAGKGGTGAGGGGAGGAGGGTPSFPVQELADFTLALSTATGALADFTLAVGNATTSLDLLSLDLLAFGPTLDAARVTVTDFATAVTAAATALTALAAVPAAPSPTATGGGPLPVIVVGPMPFVVEMSSMPGDILRALELIDQSLTALPSSLAAVLPPPPVPPPLPMPVPVVVVGPSPLPVAVTAMPSIVIPPPLPPSFPSSMVVEIEAMQLPLPVLVVNMPPGGPVGGGTGTGRTQRGFAAVQNLAGGTMLGALAGIGTAAMSGSFTAIAGAVIASLETLNSTILQTSRAMSSFAMTMASAEASSARTISEVGQSMSAFGDAQSRMVPLMGVYNQQMGQAISTIGQFIAAIDGVVKRYAQYSPGIAIAQAQAEVVQIMRDMARARALEPQLISHVYAQMELQQKFEDIKMRFLQQAIPFLNRILPLVEQMMPDVAEVARQSLVIAATILALPRILFGGYEEVKKIIAEIASNTRKEPDLSWLDPTLELMKGFTFGREEGVRVPEL